MGKILELPLLVILMGVGALAMLVPALHAWAIRDWDVARAFLFPAVLFLVLTALIGIASAARRPANPARSHLLAMLGAFVLLPLMLAVPMNEAVRDTGYFNAWWEMVSSLTTTGATLFEPGRLPPSVHLWRALVGWLGGFFMLVAGVAVLAPMNLGGFEVTGDGSSAGAAAPGGGSARTAGQGQPGPSVRRPGRALRSSQTGDRLVRHTLALMPVYGSLTLVLWSALLIAGDPALVAVCHAMSVMSTSGISPVGGLAGAQSGFVGEGLIFIFLLLALSRHMMPAVGTRWRPAPLARDPEIRMGLALMAAVPAVLFLRHWIGAVEVNDVEDIPAAAEAAWGAVFTVLSFLTTTGFESAGWDDARFWSGLPAPGLVLAGLAIIGGGVATTAGGVKLLRVYALYRHGERELQKLVHPNSVGGGGAAARRMRRQGAQVAWVFFALFAMSIAVTMLALTLTGLGFSPATVLTISALSNTGPLAAVAAEAPLAWAALGAAAKVILAAAMVLGRLETLAIIALLNPEMWRG
ncbi:potassium transporter TrkG [Frigidibacter sp.]|uniref:potassium transporter TrkG n=1 Tax=Frigidibacter sp. TaxID=2586418 RepID=UPI0027356FEC|nr:potassium transporter TrkG [Frigidibacter sp.]MDP3340151.1 potassium transporter TrkG [Frigidibacter sp.]